MFLVGDGQALHHGPLARALAPQPDILLCDEPAAGLDADGARVVLAALLDLQLLPGVTLVVASRDAAMLAVLCRRVAVLEDGGVAEQFDLADTGAPRRTALGRELACRGIEVRALLGTGKLHA
jgi:D-methionine transport system ATP-binding protein